MDLEMHKMLLNATAPEEVDPEREKTKKEVEKLIKGLEDDAKKPKKKKPSEMSLGEADAALLSLEEDKKKVLNSILEAGPEISKEEREKFAEIFKRMGGKVIVQTGKIGDSIVIEFPASKEAAAKKIKNQITRGAKGRFESVFRKEGNKVFLTFRKNR